MFDIPKLAYKLILFLIFILNNIIKADYPLEEKYYFQLYPSDNKEKPYLYYAYLPTSNFLTINSTEGENCKIIENKTVNEYPIKDLSSVASLNDNFLIKTCFGPDKIVELINKKNETFVYKNNNLLTNVNYCYTTMILDPLNQNDYVIMTYWSDFYLKNGKKRYTHKCITFNPINQTFSNEIVLTAYSNIIELFINYNYYARSCITFRSKDIYCSINLDSDESYANSFFIDTSEIYTSNPQIHLVISNTDYGENVYQKPIAIGKEIHDVFGGFFDAFLTEYHNQKEDKTTFVSTLFRKSLFATFVPVSDSSKKYYGVNVEDSYIDPNLFNHLVPNQDDLIIIYLMKTRDSMGLIMSRFNLSESVTFHKKFQEYSLSNYLQENICPNPKYMQSIYSTSFINYSNNDKVKISEKGSDYYYKYQKDIVSFISCEDENKNVYYESKKIIMPQCLNELDVLNNKDFHTFKYISGENKKTIDIYNDPKYLSLRNCTIEFFPVKVKPQTIIIKITKDEGFLILDHTRTQEVRNPIKIEIFITINFYTKVPLSIPYRIKYTSLNNNTISCHLSSDICKIDLVNKNDDDSCDIEYCLYCNETNKCAECVSTIEGIGLDEKNNKCICNIENGFQMYPKLFHSTINMCICKENYSFYKNVSLCRPNKELNNGSYYQDRIDEVSSIPIYDDCPKDCLFCRLKNNTFNCGNDTEIEPETNIDTEGETEKPFISIDGDICLNNNSIDNTWFAIGQTKFYYARIMNCNYIFDNNLLFFYSNRSDCSFNNSIKDIEYISDCLQRPELKNYNDYKNFLDNSKEYDPNDENITIYEEKENYFFHLIKNQKNSSNISDIELSDECEQILKSTYNIDNDTNLLIFKVDIKRDDTISRQVEYQFYNPNPKNIYEKLDLKNCIPNENNTLEKISEIERINISIPVDWTEKHIQYIDELYIKHGIFLFNAKEPFYNDVCFKYKTPKNTDIYLQNRREKYFLLDPLCQSGCTVISLVDPIDLNKDKYKIKCNCPLKLLPEVPENIKFDKKSLKEIFNGKYTLPNIKVLKCGGKVSIFFVIFILMIIFLASFLHRKLRGKLICLKKLQDEIDDDKQNLLDENENEQEELDHQFNRDKKKKSRKQNNNQQKEPDTTNNEIDNKINNEIDNEINKKNDSNKNKSIKNSSVGIEKSEVKNVVDSIVVKKPKDKRNKLKIEITDFKNSNKIINKISNVNSIHKKEITNNTLISSQQSEDENKSSNTKLVSEQSTMNKIIEEDKKDEGDSKKGDNKDEKDDKKEEKKYGNVKKEEKKEDKKKDKKDEDENKKKDKKNEEKEDKKKDKKDEDDDKKDKVLDVNKTEKSNKKLRKIDKLVESIKLDVNDDSSKNKIDFTKSVAPLPQNYEKDEVEVEFDNNDNNKNNLIDNILESQIFDSKDNTKIKKGNNKDKNYPSNPPRKVSGVGNNPLKSSENSLIKKRKKKIRKVKNDNKTSDYILNKSDFEEIQDGRSFLEIYISMIKYNSTLAFMFYYFKEIAKNDKGQKREAHPKYEGIKMDNDIFIRSSVFVLTFNVYIFFNILLMFNSSSLHLYLHKDKDLNEKYRGVFFFINLFLYPILFYILSSVFKRITSIREFIFDKIYECQVIKSDKDYKGKKNEPKKNLKLHEIKTEVSKYLNQKKGIRSILFLVGSSIFVLFNCYLVTCFCSVYNNSIFCLIVNIIMSVLFGFILTLILFALSSFLRYKSIKISYEIFYNISRWLNPTYVMYKNNYFSCE